MCEGKGNEKEEEGSDDARYISIASMSPLAVGMLATGWAMGVVAGSEGVS